MNVLLYYVLLRTNMKLSKVYLEKIAGHWSRKKIKTAKEALVLAKQENKDYQEWARNKKKYGTRGTAPYDEDTNTALINSIRGAITAGLNDEKLGAYVRKLLQKEQQPDK